MHPRASSGLIVGFVLLTVAVLGLVLLMVRAGAGGAGRSGTAEVTRAKIILGVWLLLSASLGLSGLLTDFSLPPKLPIFATFGLGLTIWIGASKYGGQLARDLPLWALVGINGFRLPLEMLMSSAAREGVMPVQMSYSGDNYDVLSGVMALVIALLLLKGACSQRLIRLFNIIGFALLLNVLTIAVLSMPLPFRVYMNEPANTWVAYFPFIFLPTFLVPVALLSHILLLRRMVDEVHKQRMKREGTA